MKSLNLFRVLLLSMLVAAALFVSCRPDVPNLSPDPPPSEVTLWTLNEGQFGKTPASINRYRDRKWQLRLFQAANAGKTLGGTGVSVTFHGNRIYIVSKEGCFLSQVNQADFKETARIETPRGGTNPLGDGAQARDFCIVDDKRGVLTTSRGAFVVALQPLTLGKPLTGVDANNPVCEEVCRAGDYLFLMNKKSDNKKTIKVYNANTFAFVKDLEEPGESLAGFVQTGETLWTANGREMMRINTKSLAVERIPLGNDLQLYHNKWTYTRAPLSVAKSGKAIYFIKKTEKGGTAYGKEIWRFDIFSRKSALLYKSPVENISVYGSALAVNPATGDIYAIYTEDGWGEHSLNTAIHVIDAKTGAQKAIIPYTKTGETEYWFPAMLIFNQQQNN